MERNFLFNPELTIPSLKDRKFKRDPRKEEMKEEVAENDTEGT